MSQVGTCAFCGREAATQTMDLTGLGLRCPDCSRQALIADGGDDMAHHLTPQELDETAARAHREMLLGVLLGVAGLGIWALVFFGAGSLFRTPLALMGVGICMTAHGYSVKRKAQRSRARFPDARVVQRDE